MMGMNALGVIPTVIGSALLIFSAALSIPMACAFILSGRASRQEEEEEARAALGAVLVEKRAPKTTLHTRTCPQCGRHAKWERAHDADLGSRCDEFKVCGICKAHGKSKHVFNTDTWTLEDIRRLDQEFPERQVGGSAGPGAA